MNKIAKFSALASLACFCVVAGLDRTLMAGTRPLDHVTGCPKDAKYSETFAVLLDTTDPFSPVAQEMIRKKIEDLAQKVSRYGRLEVFVVRPSSDHLIEPLLQVCNPGRGSDTNEWTGNPRLMEKRWHDKFWDPLDKSLRDALSGSVPAKQSPIMEEIQQVSVEAFYETSANTSKRLVIVSDLLQNSDALNQYHDPETFDEFEHRPSFVKVRPELRDVDVTILYVRRTSDFRRQGQRHVEFWDSFFAASGARVDEVKSVP